MPQPTADWIAEEADLQVNNLNYTHKLILLTRYSFIAF
jgi:hypothetical protein